MKSQISNLKFLLSVFLLCLASAAQAVPPQSASITNLREEATAYVSDFVYFQNQQFLLTNCVAYSGTGTNSARQNLTNCTLTVTIGTTSSSTNFTASADNLTNGTWYCQFLMPTNSTEYILQFEITDETTNTYIYPWKYIKTKAAL